MATRVPPDFGTATQDRRVRLSTRERFTADDADKIAELGVDGLAHRLWALLGPDEDFVVTGWRIVDGFTAGQGAVSLDTFAVIENAVNMHVAVNNGHVLKEPSAGPIKFSHAAGGALPRIDLLTIRYAEKDSDAASRAQLTQPTLTQVLTDTGLIPSAVGDGVTKLYTLANAGVRPETLVAKVNAVPVAAVIVPGTGAGGKDQLAFAVPPESGAPIVVAYWFQTGGVEQTATLNTRWTSTYEAQVVQGVEAATPAIPATPSGWMKLADVAVAAGATSVANANITDRRNFVANDSADVGVTGTITRVSGWLRRALRTELAHLDGSRDFTARQRFAGGVDAGRGASATEAANIRLHRTGVDGSSETARFRAGDGSGSGNHLDILLVDNFTGAPNIRIVNQTMGGETASDPGIAFGASLTDLREARVARLRTFGDKQTSRGVLWGLTPMVKSLSAGPDVTITAGLAIIAGQLVSLPGDLPSAAASSLMPDFALPAEPGGWGFVYFRKDAVARIGAAPDARGRPPSAEPTFQTDDYVFLGSMRVGAGAGIQVKPSLRSGDLTLNLWLSNASSNMFFEAADGDRAIGLDVSKTTTDAPLTAYSLLLGVDGQVKNRTNTGDSHARLGFRQFGHADATVLGDSLSVAYIGGSGFRVAVNGTKPSWYSGQLVCFPTWSGNTATVHARKINPTVDGDHDANVWVVGYYEAPWRFRA